MGLLLGLYFLSLVCLGMWVHRKLGFPFKNTSVSWVVVGTLGIFFSTWITYGVSWIFRNRAEPLLFGSVGTILILTPIILSVCRNRKEYVPNYSLRIYEVLLVGGCVLFAAWVMGKSLGITRTGTIYVASNAVYDLGQHLGIVRSFSWGKNIPFISPFIAGTPYPLYFLFYFFSGILEYLGLPLVWAINIPSIFSFAGMLILSYYLPQFFFGKRNSLGILALLFTVTNATLTWVYVLGRGISPSAIESLWTNQTYFFSHPYDSSMISIFWTLNSYVNQRHLAFGIVVCLLVWLYCIEFLKRGLPFRKKSLFLGIIVGFFPLWHTFLFGACLLVVSGLLILHRKWQELILFLLVTMVIALPQLVWLFVPTGGNFKSVEVVAFHPWFTSYDMGTIGWYWWNNLGILPILGFGGWLLVNRKMKILLLPFGLLFLAVHLKNLPIEITHKLINVWLIIANGVAAYCLVRLWEWRRIGKILVLTAVPILMLSGILDLMVVKNDFRYPITDAGKDRLINFLHEHVAPTSVILSYPEVFDPVVLAGRKNYLGLYRKEAYPSRARIVGEIYAASAATIPELLKKQGISYLSVEKFSRQGLGYTIDPQKAEEMRKEMPVVFEDNDRLLFQAFQ